MRWNQSDRGKGSRLASLPNSPWGLGKTLWLLFPFFLNIWCFSFFLSFFMALKKRCLCSHPQSYDHTTFHRQSPYKPTCACLFLGSEHVMGHGCSPETNTRGTCCFSPRQLFITWDSGQERATGHSWEHGLSRWGQFSDSESDCWGFSKSFQRLLVWSLSLSNREYWGVEGVRESWAEEYWKMPCICHRKWLVLHTVSRHHTRQTQVNSKFSF